MAGRTVVQDQVRWLRSLHELTSGVDLVAFEERSPEEVREGLLPLANKVIRISMSVFERLSKAYDSVAEPERGRPLRASEHEQEIADLCFIARMEISPRITELSAPVDPHDKWTILSACSHAFGCIAKAIFALEPRLSIIAGEEPALKRATSVDQAVRVRRVYHNFHRQVTLDGPPEAQNVHDRLEAARAAIHRLVTSPVYAQLRGSDRCQLRRLEERVAAWLGQIDANATEGIEIWKDLSALAAMFQQINRRQDLIDHDRLVLAEMALALSELDPAMKPRPTLLTRLALVLGRDEELDAMLDEPDRVTCGRVLLTVRRALSELEGSVDRVPACV